MLAGPAFGQSAVSVQLTGGVDGGAYFSVNSGFNVVGVEVAAGAGSPVQRFTARADGDGANTVFDLTDALAVTFEGDILVSDETPTGAVDGVNRLFTPLQTMGDSGIAHDNLPDGYWAREDIVVQYRRRDVAVGPVRHSAGLPDGHGDGADPDPPVAAGGGGRHTVHLQDANFRHSRPGRDAYLGARFRH